MNGRQIGNGPGRHEPIGPLRSRFPNLRRRRGVDQNGLPGPEEEPAMTTLPEVRVGDPIRHEALTVFPLFSPPDEANDYLLSDEALAAGSVTVEEVHGAAAPALPAHSRRRSPGGIYVLFLEGEEFEEDEAEPSARTPRHQALRQPASGSRSDDCVEQGRRRPAGGGRRFLLAEASRLVVPKLRHFSCKRSVGESLKSGQGHTSDQMAVWGEVSRQMASPRSASEVKATIDLRSPARTGSRSSGSGSSMSRVRAASPWPWVRTSSRWTCSTGPRPAARSGIGC